MKLFIYKILSSIVIFLVGMIIVSHPASAYLLPVVNGDFEGGRHDGAIPNGWSVYPGSDAGAVDYEGPFNHSPTNSHKTRAGAHIYQTIAVEKDTNLTVFVWTAGAGWANFALQLGSQPIDSWTSSKTSTWIRQTATVYNQNETTATIHLWTTDGGGVVTDTYYDDVNVDQTPVNRAPLATITCSRNPCRFYRDEIPTFNVTANANGETLKNSQVYIALQATGGRVAPGNKWPYVNADALNQYKGCPYPTSGDNPWCGIYQTNLSGATQSYAVSWGNWLPPAGTYYVEVNATNTNNEACSGNPDVDTNPGSYPTWKNCGSNDHVTLQIIDREPPECSFTAVPLISEAPSVITFTNSSKFTVKSMWNFGDGQTQTDSTVMNPYPGGIASYTTTHSYTQAGPKTITLNVENIIGVPGSCPAQTITVNPCKPDAVQIVYPSHTQIVSKPVLVQWRWIPPSKQFNNTCIEAMSPPPPPNSDPLADNNDHFDMLYSEWPDTSANTAVTNCQNRDAGTLECYFPQNPPNPITDILGYNKTYFVKVRADNGAATTDSGIVQFTVGPQAWYQVLSGMIHADAENIMASVTDAIRSTIPFKSCNTCTFFPFGGVVTWGSGTLSLGNEVSSLGEGLSPAGVPMVSAISGTYMGKKYDYDYWLKKVGDKATVGVDVSTSGIYASDATYDDAAGTADWVFPGSGNILDKDIVVLHNGNMILNRDVTVGNGCTTGNCKPDGSLVLIARTITVTSAVKQLHAILIADTITFEGGTTINLTNGSGVTYTEADDPQLDMQGSVIGWDTVIFQRNLGYASSAPNTTVNSDEPAEKITYRPDMVESLRRATKVTGSPLEAMADFSYTWKEVTP